LTVAIVGDRTIATGATTAVSATKVIRATTAVSATKVIRVIAATGLTIAISEIIATISAEGRSAMTPVKPALFRQKPGPGVE
jgi:hypothetical protein